MKRTSYTEFTEVRLDVLTTVSEDGTIVVNVRVPTRKGTAIRETTGKLDHNKNGWRVFDHEDQHTGIIEVSKARAIQVFTRRQMALMAGWAVHETLSSFIGADPGGVA